MPATSRFGWRLARERALPGNEAEFSSSSPSGSFAVPEVRVCAAGNQNSSFSRNHGSFGWNNGSSSLDDNSLADTVKPQNPEQHWTPLQQKEVLIHHLKRKLQDSESKLKERETEIEGLKAQLGRMKDEWLEQECSRVEVELACWEARTEIKDLKKINASLEKRLAETEKKIRKYGVILRSTNKRLEYLLAQNSAVLEAQFSKDTCEWEGKPSVLSATVPTSLIPEDQALEKAADSRLHEDTAHKTDSFEESLTTTTSELSDPPPSPSAVKPEALENILHGKPISSQEKEKIGTVMVKQASHTDMMVADSLDVEQPIQNVERPQDACPLSPLALGKESGEERVKEKQFVKAQDFPEPDEDEALEYVNTISQTGHKRPRRKSRLLRGLLAVTARLAGSLRKRASSLHWLKGGTRRAAE